MSRSYKIAFFDIDGTLRVIDKDYIPESTIKAIKRLKEKRIKVIICSGRNYDQVPDYVKALGFDYYICYNGASITDGEGNIIRMSCIDGKTAKKLKQSFVEQDCVYSLKFLSGKKVQYGDMRDFTALFFKPGFEPMADADADLDKEQLLAGVYKDPGNHLEEMKKQFPIISFVHVTKNYYDFTIKEATKGSAIQYLCKMLGITREEAIAFGDGENDITMFENVNMSVAMGNADEGVKKRAKYVTASVEEDGIYQAIERFFAEE